MKWVRSIVGYFFAGTLVFSIWGGIITADFGHIGGVLAGMLIIGPMWFMNHALNLVGHGPNSGFVDLGLGVGVSGLANSTVAGLMAGDGLAALTDAIPTLIVVIVGGIFGGYLAALVEKDFAKDNK